MSSQALCEHRPPSSHLSGGNTGKPPGHVKFNGQGRSLQRNVTSNPKTAADSQSVFERLT